MAVLCGVPTIQYSARSDWLSVRLWKWVCPKITSGQSNLTRRIVAVNGWFSVIRQVTATCPSIRTHWRHLANTIELVHSSAHSSPQPKRQMDRFSRFCTAYVRKCLYFTMGSPIHQNCPFPWGIWTSHVTHDAFGPCESTTQMAPRSDHPSLHV